MLIGEAIPQAVPCGATGLVAVLQGPLQDPGTLRRVVLRLAAIVVMHERLLRVETLAKQTLTHDGADQISTKTNREKHQLYFKNIS